MFKVGDRVKYIGDDSETFVVEFTEETSEGQRVVLNNSAKWLRSMFFEKVEPSVPVSKIREVFNAHMPHANSLGGKLLLRQLFRELTEVSLLENEP